MFSDSSSPSNKLSDQSVPQMVPAMLGNQPAIQSVAPSDPINPAKKPRGSGNPSGRALNQRLTVRQQRYIGAIATGKAKDRKDAAKIAGYSKSSQPANIERTVVRNALSAALYKAGVSEQYLADKIKEGLDANQTKFFAFEGQVKTERVIADFDVREKYLRDSLEVMGFIRNPTIENLNIGLIQMPQSQEDAAWEAEAVEMPASSGRK
mgnify:CR=1 FL=1